MKNVKSLTYQQIGGAADFYQNIKNVENNLTH